MVFGDIGVADVGCLPFSPCQTIPIKSDLKGTGLLQMSRLK